MGSSKDAAKRAKVKPAAKGKAKAKASPATPKGKANAPAANAKAPGKANAPAANAKAPAKAKAPAAKAKAPAAKAKAPAAKAKALAAKLKAKAPAAKAAPTKAAPKKAAPGKQPAAKPSGPPSAAFTSIAAILGQNGGVGTRKMFGAHSLNLGGHAFVMEYKGDLVVRLPAARVTELTAGGTGTPFDPGMGRPSKGWLTVRQGGGDWQRLAEEGLAHVGTLPPK